MPTAKKTTTKPSAKKRAVVRKNSTTVLESMESLDSKTSSTPFKLEVVSRKTKITLIVLAIAALLGIILFANRGFFIAGLVNGEPISRIEVIQELEKQQGAGVLNRLIDRKLIIQEADKQKVTVTQEEIDAKRKEIVDQVSSGNEENFKQILTAQGLTQESFIEELRIQLYVEKMLEEKTHVTDEEFNQFVKDNPDLLANAENEKDSKAQIREQLKQQKLQTEYNTWMESLRNNGNIVRFVNY